MEYFIADTHFGHENILKLANRPFASVEEMDETIIRNWNARVKKHADTVYIVGDFIWEEKDPTPYLSKLNGKKVLITGNHDEKWLKKYDVKGYFQETAPYFQNKILGKTVTFCHYPMLEWKDCRKMGSKKLGWHIHGHIHGKFKSEYAPLFLAPHALNAGVDVNGFMPVTFDELVKNNEIHKLHSLPTMEEKARFLATKYHIHQTDKVGKPYIEHPKAVASFVEGEAVKTVAWLHDIIEDTDIELSLLQEIFPEEVVKAVLTMTHEKSEDYFSYVRRVKENPIARQVKLADLKHNSDLTRLKTITEYDLERVEKYAKARAILLGEET